MATRTVSACDRCGKEPASRFRVGDDGQLLSVDLCAEHAAPVVELMELARSLRTGARQATTTMAEINRRKRERKN